MADFAKRSEITISTMGRVHNPTGEGVRAVSSQVAAKKNRSMIVGESSEKNSSAVSNGMHKGGNNVKGMKLTPAQEAVKDNNNRETKVKEGTAKRNIQRKKTADRDSGNYNSTHKKQGGHGKGQWKQDMDPVTALEVEDGGDIIDENDPLYDEAEDATKYILTSGGGQECVDEKRGYDPGTSKAIYGPMLTLQEFKIQLSLSLQEYFDSCDADEVVRGLVELRCQEYHAATVKKAISLALDKGPRERELISRLLTCLHPTPLSEEDMQAGFEALLDAMDDLSKDVPDASTMVASFLARAVVDEVLPPAFMSDQNNSRLGDPVIEKAVSLLNREHCTARLEHIWGPGDGRPVPELKKEMDQLLLEYLQSRELDEAAQCVKELEASHFHHELVKRGVFLAMELDGKEAAVVSEDGGDATDILSNMDAMAAMFGFLVRNAIMSEYQVKKGVARLHKVLPDLTLDVPRAPALLEAFEEMAMEREGLAIG